VVRAAGLVDSIAMQTATLRVLAFAASTLAAAAVANAPRPARAAADPPTVAVLYFDYEGKDGELGLLKKGLAQMLISDLSATTSVRVVERDRLESVLGELKLQQSAKIDQASAVKAGKLLGARYLVLGGYFDVMKTLRTDARVVEVETGRVLQSFGANGKPDDFLALEQKLAGDLVKYFETSLPAAPSKTPPPSGKTPTGNESPPPKPRPKRPPTMKASTVVEYGRALNLKDKGDKAGAKEALAKVLKEQPDFGLAAEDLALLTR
jgi:TolB-like protein